MTHVLIDMDGVLFRGARPLEGAADFVGWLGNQSIRFRLLTNNSTMTPAQNAAKLKTMGIAIRAEDIFTSSLATAAYVREHGGEGQRAYVVGEEGLTTALAEVGIIVSGSPAEVSWVVVGLDRRLTYQKLSAASLALQRGARFVATNADTSLPVEVGVAPGAGAILAALTATTGIRPVVVGKPEPAMLDLAMRTIGGTPSNTVMLGDRLDTDIEAARRAGIASILVLTGVTRKDDLRSSDVAPDVVVADLPHLLRAWQDLPARQR